ncbi:MAG: cyclic-di-AMP receptor [Tissierellia bacterium]|nr:cyclic-di-AMP receptor [Tissierellia bacterium]
MKLLLAVVQDNDVNILMEDLIENGFSVTKLSSTGGFLRSGNTTIFMGVDDDKMDECFKIIERNCKKRTATTAIVNPNMQGAMFQTFPVEITVGGATVFVINVEQFLKL